MTRSRTVTSARALVALLGLTVVTGCATTTAVRDPAYAPVRPVERVATPAPAMPATNGGAIYQAGREISLFEDQRARRVGDILTIRLVEKTDANKKAKTNSKKANETTITTRRCSANYPLLICLPHMTTIWALGSIPIRISAGKVTARRATV